MVTMTKVDAVAVEVTAVVGFSVMMMKAVAAVNFVF
jgi:hypothetical protein